MAKFAGLPADQPATLRRFAMGFSDSVIAFCEAITETRIEIRRTRAFRARRYLARPSLACSTEPTT